jgi:NhaP-type Na+/H+ or K+/H+ antiporter
VLYKAAVGAALGGTFSLLDTSGRIVLNVVGGIAIGLAVG